MRKVNTLGLVLSMAFAVFGVTVPAAACTVITVPGDYSTISQAIGAASYCDQVHVSAGIYHENVIMKAGVDVVGAGADVTVISSLDIVVMGADDATIQGFTITGGSIGIRANNVSNFSVFNNVVTNISNPFEWGGAEGINITNSTDVFICNNEVNHVGDVYWNRAAGIFLNGNSSLIVYGNTISDIWDRHWDSAYGIFDGNSSGSRIVGNVVYLIRDGEWESSFGIYENGSFADVGYNTIVFIIDQLWDNAYGIYGAGTNVAVSNNIVAHITEADWGTAYGICNVSTASVVSYNDVWDVREVGGWPGPGVPYCDPIGEGNLMKDPRFVNPAARDFHLRPDSPLLEASESGGEIGAYGAPCLCQCDIDIDVKPGSCPNSWNRESNGVLPVAILGTADFDVTQIDVSSVTISRGDGTGGSVAPNEGPPGPHSVFEDVGTPFDGEECDCHEAEGDGVLDLSMKFKTQDVADLLPVDDPDGALVPLVVSGTLFDGTEFTTKSDCVRLVPPGSPPGQVTVQSAPGSWVNATPLDDNLDGGGFGSFQRTYPHTTVLTLKGPAGHNGNPFVGWKLDGGDLVQGRKITFVVNNAEHVAKAVFKKGASCGLGLELALLLPLLMRLRRRRSRAEVRG